MATGFQILPTMNRPTVSDAISGLIDTIQGRRAQQQKQQALVDYQQQRLQQQAQSDAADKQAEAEQTQYDRSQQQQQDEYDRRETVLDDIRGMDLPAKKRAYAQLSPQMKQQFGYDPTTLPDEAPEGPKPGDVERTRHNKAMEAVAGQRVKQAADRGKPKMPNYADPTQPDFEEHPAVKDYNDKLRKLTAVGQQIMSDQVQVRDYDKNGKSVMRPLNAQEKAVRLHSINTTIQDLVGHRSSAVGALRAHGVKVAQAPDDTFYADQSAPQAGGAGGAGGADEPEPDDSQEEEGQEQAQGKPLDAQTAANFIKMANGDNNKARALAQAAGYSIGGQ